MRDSAVVVIMWTLPSSSLVLSVVTFRRGCWLNMQPTPTLAESAVWELPVTYSSASLLLLHRVLEEEELTGSLPEQWSNLAALTAM